MLQMIVKPIVCWEVKKTCHFLSITWIEHKFNSQPNVLLLFLMWPHARGQIYNEYDIHFLIWMLPKGVCLNYFST